GRLLCPAPVPPPHSPASHQRSLRHTRAATSQVYTLSPHDALPIYQRAAFAAALTAQPYDHAKIVALLGDQTRLATDLGTRAGRRSEEHTSELQSRENLVCRLLLEKKQEPFLEYPADRVPHVTGRTI